MKIVKYPLAVLLLAAGVFGSTVSVQASALPDNLCDIAQNEPDTLRCDQIRRDGWPRGSTARSYRPSPDGFLSNMLDGESVLLAVALTSGRSRVLISDHSLEDEQFDVLMRRGAPPTESLHDLRCDPQQIAANQCVIVDDGQALSPLFIRLIARKPIEQSGLLVVMNNGNYTGRPLFIAPCGDGSVAFPFTSPLSTGAGSAGVW